MSDFSDCLEKYDAHSVLAHIRNNGLIGGTTQIDSQDLGEAALETLFGPKDKERERSLRQTAVTKARAKLQLENYTLTEKEAAKEIGVKLGELRKLLKEGKLMSTKYLDVIEYMGGVV